MVLNTAWLALLYLSSVALTYNVLTGEVIFDRNHPGEPPDIIFSPKDEITDFCPNLENIPVSNL